MVWLGLPCGDDESAQNVLNAFRHLDRVAIRNELVHRSPFLDDVEESIDEFSLGLHGKNINDK